MRQPTDLYAAFAFWRDALAGIKRPIHADDPQCGFYSMRLRRGGVSVPVAIWIEQQTNSAGELLTDEKMLCLVNGREAEPADVWSYCVRFAIPEREYRYLEARHKWARAYAPCDPFANPHKKIDPLALAPVF